MLKAWVWRFLLRAAVACGPILVPAAVLASAAISQSYVASDSTIVQGTILSLTSNGSNRVQPAVSTGTTGLVGVAVSQPVLQLSGSSTGSIQVAVGGTAQVLIDDLNGPVMVGDKITASPLNGVGMKAVNAGEVIGVAQADLTGVTTTSRTIADNTGKSTGVKIGLVPVALSIEYYSGSGPSTLSAFVPSFLQDLANAIADKPVSPARVLVCLLILVLGFTAATIMLYGAVRNCIVSTGRNPLAGPALRKGLVDVILAALGILLITGVLAYTILAK